MSKEIYSNKPEKREEVFDPYQLTFKQLKTTYDLAQKSYQLTEDGIRGIGGGGMTIEMQKGLWRVVSASEYDIPGVGRYMTTHAVGSILETGSPDKIAMINAMREMIEELGYRIVE